MAIIYSSKNVNDLVNYSKAKLSLGGGQLSDEYYYDSLPLCLIDATFSIGVRYSSTSKTVNNYSVSKGIKKISKPLGMRSDSYKIDDLINDIQNIADFGASTLFKNHQRTSSRNGILKAQAVLEAAKVLKSNGINDFASFSNELPSISSNLFENIKGQNSGISFQYFLMLAGDDNYLKIDRWLLRFLKDATGIDFSSDLVAAHNIYIRACNKLKVIYPNLNPRLYDHTIWLFMTK